MWTVGDRVRHPARPEWGVGEVLSRESNDKLLVRFTGAGKRLLKGAPLERVTGADAHGPLVFSRTARLARAPKRQHTLEEYRTVFVEAFPRGFRDPDFIGRERDYKLDASEYVRTELAERALQRLLKTHDYPEVCRRALAALSKTNLVFKTENIKLRDGLRTTHAQRAFARALFDLLHDSEPFGQRFERFVSVLQTVGAPFWTVATYFPFLAAPADHIFVKPMPTRRIADACGIALNYRPAPNLLTYECALDLTRTLTQKLKDLKPRDMIDLQSFIWVVAREGKPE